MPTTNLADAIRFIRWLNQKTPAIYTLGTESWPVYRTDGKTSLKEILEENQNTYFSPAQTVPGLKKKALKTELVSTCFFHVDLDPIDGRDPLKEQDRLYDLVTDSRPSAVPAPSCIIASGRGLQCLWRTKEPIALPEGQESVEQVNLWLMEKLQAPQGTHDVTRILRMPGSWNALSPQKIAKGYQPRQAQLIEINELVYTLEDFGKGRSHLPDQSHETPRGNSASHGGSADDIQDDVIPVKDLSKYDVLKLPLRVKWLISYGTPSANLSDYERDFGPLNGRSDSDRSAWVYDVCCQMLRYGVARGEILGLLTDPAWGISGHCLDQKDPDRAARRQLARAASTVSQDAPRATSDGEPDDDDSDDRDDGGEDLRGPRKKAIDEINDEYFAILNGGKLQFYRDEQHKVVLLEEKAFKFELADKMIEGIDDKTKKPKLIPAVKIWMSHPDRRYYRDGFLLDPTSETSTAYNLWKGFGVEPKQGNWDIMRQHIHNVLADKEEEYSDYIIKWAAWAFQNPATPPGTALVFRGIEGTGKGLFCNALVSAFGNHGLRIQSMRHIVGNFNAHLRHCCLLFCDEAVTPGSDGEGALKGLITERNIPIEAKGVDVVNMPNHLHVCMASNEDYVVPAGKEARRFGVFDVSPNRLGDKAYFDLIVDQMNNGGLLEAMLFDLLSMDLSKFTPEACLPKTFALSDQKAQSLQGFERVWLDCLRTGEVPFTRFADSGGIRPFVSTGSMRQHAAERLKTEISVTSVGRTLSSLGYDRDETARPRGFNLPDLGRARAAWDSFKFKIKWDNTKCWSALDVSGDRQKPTRNPEEDGQHAF